MLAQFSIEDIIDHYDILIDNNNGARKAYTPDEIINRFDIDAIIEHIDFIRKSSQTSIWRIC